MIGHNKLVTLRYLAITELKQLL